MGSGINSIFNKLFDDGGRTLNHLACGNLISDGVWKEMDDIGHYGELKGSWECRGS